MEDFDSNLSCTVYCTISCILGFPGAQMVKNLPALQETGFQPLGWKIPWRRKSLLIPVFLPGEFHGQKSLAEHGIAKSWTRLND